MQGSSEHVILMEKPQWGIDASPLWSVCRSGNFPTAISCDVIVDWSHCSFAPVSHIAAAAAVQSAAYSFGFHTSCIPSNSADRYIARMDYYKMVGIEHNDGFIRHAERDRFLPLSRIEEFGANEVAAKLRSTVTSHLSFSESAVDMMDYAFGEVLDNVLQHSKTLAPGIACSQFYQRGNYVDVCVADCGRGVPASMSNNLGYRGLDDNALLVKAFDKFTGEYFGVPDYGSSEVSGGMGLWIAANIVKALSGHIWVVSMGSAIDVSVKGIESVSGMYFPGTVVCMRFPVSDKVISGDDVFGNGSKQPTRWTPGDSWWYEGSDDEVLW